MALSRLLLFCLAFCWATPLFAQNGCTASSPLASFKLYVKPPQYAAYPLREVNELQPGMKILYQPLQISGTNPKDARIALILAESVHDAETQQLVVMEPQRADQVAEWELPFRTQIVALAFGPQGLSESRVGKLVKRDAALVKELASYAEQNQRMEDLIQILAESEKGTRPGESLDAALTGFATRHGMPMAPLNRQASTSDQALALMRTLNPTLSTYDPLAPNPTQRLQQSAGLAATVAGLFWGGHVALYAGGAGLFLNMRSLMFPGSEFRSALMQSTDNQRLTLCARATQHKSRTRIAYLWAARIPDADAPVFTISQRVHAGAGLDTEIPITVAPGTDWRLLGRAQEWRLLSSDDGAEYPVNVQADRATSSLRFRVPASVPEGAYNVMARWDWQLMRPAGYLQVHAVHNGEGPVLSRRSRQRLLDGSRDVEIAVEQGNFRFVEQATLRRKDDPYATPRTVPLRIQDRGDDVNPSLFVLLNGTPLTQGTWQLALKQTGGKELLVDVPVLPQPPTVRNLPLRLNVGSQPITVSLEGERLHLIRSLEADGVRIEELSPAGGGSQDVRTVKLAADTSARPGDRVTLRVALTDRDETIELPAAIEILGPLPELLSSRLAHRETNGIALQDEELAAGGLVTTLLTAKNVSASTSLNLQCTAQSLQVEALSLRPGQTSPDARLQLSGGQSLYLTFDPGKIGQHGCRIEARLQSEAGVSEPMALGRVVRLPKLEGLTLSDELLGDDLFAATLIGQDLEAVAAVGWEPERAVPVSAIPRPREGDSRKQELRVSLPWPSPTPRSPIMVWLHGETEGRLTTTRAGL
jgi:hypothetical protein